MSLPIGIILMYDGSGIANAATRSTEIGDEVGDTIEMPGWYVCNGNAGTPNLKDKFIRSMSSSGNTGGADIHTLTEAEMPAHYHQCPHSTEGGGAGRFEVTSHGETGQTNTKSTGGGLAHNNMPAFYSLIFIYKKE